MSRSVREPVRIMIAEDDSLIAGVLRGLLEGGGFVVEGIAPDGRKAVEMAQRLRPDCILLDIRMPHMDGLEAARHIQKICPTPLVALTAYETPDLIQRANEVGISAYLVKPPDFREVERAIVLAMGRFTDMMELRRLNDDLGIGIHHPWNMHGAHISGMTSSAEHLLSDHANLSPEELERYLDIILRSARKMNEIVSALLLLAETREADVGVELLDMSQIVTEAKELLSGMIEEHQAELVEPETWPVALGNVGWVESAWVNYISNAVKYGGHPPRVELGADLQSPGMVRFWVEDNGEGIPPDELEHVFVPFSQLGHPTGYRGHGLGLSIVQRSIDKLGGQVGVESELGKGSTFYFTLPAAEDT